MKKIRDEKLQRYIKIEVAKLSVLTSDKIDKYEYLTGKEMLLLDQSRVLEPAASDTYSPLGKKFEKKIKTIETQVKHKTEAIEEHRKPLVESTELIKK